MTVRIKIILPTAIGMAFLVLAASAQAQTACNEKVVRDRLAVMEMAFRQPDMQTKLIRGSEGLAGRQRLRR